MSKYDSLEELAKRAREAKAPDVDVVDRVLRVLHESDSGAAPGLDPFVWVAGATAGVAVAVALLSASAWGLFTDPLAATLLDIMGAIG